MSKASSHDDEPALPQGWAVVPLGEIAKVQLGKMLDKARIAGVRLPYLRNINVRWGRIDTSDLSEMPFRDEELERFGIQDGDVLVCEGGEPGRAAVWQGGPTELKYQKALHRVRLPESIAPHWLVHSLYYDSVRGLLAKQFTGTTIAHLTGEAIKEYPLRVAPPAEQVRVLEAVSSYFSRLDDAVATLERVERNLKRYRASVLKSAVEGRLVPTEAALAKQEGRDYEPASVLLERILTERRRRWSESGKKGKYQEPKPPDTTNLPDLPEGWCWASVDQLAAHEPRSLCDGPFGSNLKSEHYTDSGPRVVRLQNIGDGVFRDESAHVSEQHFQSLIKHSVHPGDLVIASLGEVLPRAVMIPEWLGPAIVKADCLRFAVNHDFASATYVMHALNSLPIRKRTEELVHGVGRPRIGLGLLRQIAVPVPPREEQERIVLEIERVLSVAQANTGEVQHVIARTKRLRQSILQWAFEGKLADQDPTDEPASVLLERIKAERETAKPSKPTRPQRGAGQKFKTIKKQTRA